MNEVGVGLHAAPSYRFGSVEVRPVERKVLVEGREVVIGSRAFDVCIALIEHRDRLVTKDELLDLAWPGLVVEENNLQVQVSTLRKILGADVVATVPGRGYRFAAHVVEGPEPRGPMTSAHPIPVAALGAIIGREREIAALLQLVDERRLVTIVGPGGIGKTRVAREIVGRLAPRFTNGVCWVDLAAVALEQRVVQAIAHSAHLEVTEGDPLALLARALGHRDTLLVFDNCEHLAAEVARVAHVLLEAGSRLRVLATSQDILRISDECVFRLDALEVPAAGTPLAEARGCGAMQLLETRTRAVDRRFVLSDENLSAAIDICAQLDGNALAIEMAAARVPLLGLEGVAARLGERLRILRLEWRDVPARHRTLRATLDWSHAMLHADEQAVLRRLAVFAGSFRPECAQRVAADARVDEWSALDALGALVDKSLVSLEQLDPPRYRLLETTRLYVAEKLAEHKEEQGARDHHRKAMEQVAAEAERAFWLESDESWLATYGPDYDDLERAFDLACEQQDAQCAGVIIQVLTRFDGMRNLFIAARRRKTAALALVPAADASAAALLWNALAAFRFTAVPGASRAEIDRNRTNAWRKLGNARELYEALARTAANVGREDDVRVAEAALAEAVALEDPHWPPRLRLLLWQARALAHAYRSDWPACAECYEEAVFLAQRAGATRMVAAFRADLAEAQLMAGDFAAAIESGKEAIAQLRAFDQPFNLEGALCVLCGALVMADDLPSARSILAQAFPFVEDSGMQGAPFDHAALLATRSGRHADAARILGFADACYAREAERREPNEERSATLAALGITTALGSDAAAKHRAAGIRMTRRQADAVVRSVLEPASGGP